jgi:hypothetical protein
MAVSGVGACQREEVADMEPMICKICKEPIWNFLCVECIAKDIRGMLPSHLTPGFSKFHHNIKKYFYNRNHGTFCVRCRGHSAVSVCPYCYLNEAGNWLMGADQIMAKRLLRLIPPFGHRHSFPNESVSMNFTEAITELDDQDNKGSAPGVCDFCGEFSEALTRTEQGWICEECAET